MNYSYNMDVAELEEEVRKKNYDPGVVFAKFGNPESGEMVRPSLSFASEQRKLWKPKAPGDIHVEVRKSRFIPGVKGKSKG